MKGKNPKQQHSDYQREGKREAEEGTGSVNGGGRGLDNTTPYSVQFTCYRSVHLRAM